MIHESSTFDWREINLIIWLSVSGIEQPSTNILILFPSCKFLCFNQVFLSATPQHWCNVSELLVIDPSLTPAHVKKLSIPLRDLGFEVYEGYEEYEKCRQFDVNFTQVYLDNGGAWPERGNDSWPKSECKEGWVYDPSEYHNTLVTEVSNHLKCYLR